MALQNIGAGNNDVVCYRYKMPRMLTKIEGCGNGIRTNVINMVDIAAKYHWDILPLTALGASYTTKYFGYELGAQSKFDEKTGIALVNGAHDTAKLAGLLDNFIKKFVQCYGCGNPETEVIITKTKMIQLKCAACGFVSDVDIRDKLTAFIGEAADDNVAHEEKDDGVQWATDTSLEAARKPDMVMLTTAEAKREKPKPAAKKVVAAATNGPAVAANNEPGAKSHDVPDNGQSANGSRAHKQLVEKIQGNLKGCSVGQLKSFLGSLNGGSDPPQDIMNALIDALFGGVVHNGFSKEVTKKKNYLAAATHDNEGSQILLLRAIGAFCEKSVPEIVKEIWLVLKTLYDEDVLEEEYIVQWFNEGLASSSSSKNSQILKYVKPFIVWLQSAESESE
ncbi:hypothetical protein MKX03_007322 [Papaver bracteatum]|nr:hypothetical protein MKX03_007322 [Papaver bracteatum]